MLKLHQVLLLCLLTFCSSVLCQDCSSVKCPDIDVCPHGTELVLLNRTNSGDIYDECCEAFECKPIGCDLGLVQLESGESLSLDSCTECVCTTGTLNCTQKTCPQLKCRFSEYEGYLNDDACCKSCIPRAGPDPIPTCRYGRFFINPSNPCLSCTCMHGRTSCIDVSGICQDLSNCSKVVRVDGQCCSVCNDTKQGENTQAPAAECTTDSGGKYKDGESWSEGSCKNCTCASGAVSCTEEACPDITCDFYEVERIPLGKCCPRCVSRLIIEPPLRPRCKEEFLDLRDPCKKCSCHNGLTSCMKKVCPHIPSSCSRVARPEGQCCSVCQDEDNSSATDAEPSTSDSDIATPTTTTTTTQFTTSEETVTPSNEPTTCEFRGRTLQHRERIIDSPCSMCICLRGYMACTQHSCPETECPPFQQLTYSPDQCCPTCTGPTSSTLDTKLVYLTGKYQVTEDSTSTPQTAAGTPLVIIDEDSTAPPKIIAEKPGIVIDIVVEKGSNRLTGHLVQDTLGNIEKLQAKPTAQQDEITGPKSFVIMSVGVCSLVLLVTFSTISLITIIYHYRRRKAQKQATVSETTSP